MAEIRNRIKNGRLIREAKVDHPHGRVVAGKRVPVQTFWREIPKPTGRSKSDILNIGKVRVKRNIKTGQFI